jgi:hypothetical protein
MSNYSSPNQKHTGTHRYRLRLNLILEMVWTQNSSPESLEPRSFWQKSCSWAHFDILNFKIPQIIIWAKLLTELFGSPMIISTEFHNNMETLQLWSVMVTIAMVIGHGLIETCTMYNVHVPKLRCSE